MLAKTPIRRQKNFHLQQVRKRLFTLSKHSGSPPSQPLLVHFRKIVWTIFKIWQIAAEGFHDRNWFPESIELCNGNKIGCGHTTTRASKGLTKYADKAPLSKLFPLSVKIWPQAAVVTANLNRKDSIIKRELLSHPSMEKQYKKLLIRCFGIFQQMV